MTTNLQPGKRYMEVIDMAKFDNIKNSDKTPNFVLYSQYIEHLPKVVIKIS